jgi:hypothetical protein
MTARMIHVLFLLQNTWETRNLENIVVGSIPWAKNSVRTDAGHCPKTTCRNACNVCKNTKSCHKSFIRGNTQLV